MKKIMFVVPLLALSFLASCNNGGKSNTYTITFNCSNCKAYDINDKEVSKIQVPVSSYSPYYKFHFESTGDYFSPVKSSIDVKKTNTEEKIDFTFDKELCEILVPVNSDLTITASGLAKPTLEDCTWKQIAEISASGKAEEYFDIYDPTKPDLNCKEVYLKGQDFPHIVRIIDFNHDTDANGNPIGITFEFANVITEGTTEPTNSLVDFWNGEGQYEDATNYDYRNSTMNDLLNNKSRTDSVINMLPDDLSEEGIIKPANKLVGVSTDEGVTYIPTPFEEGKLPKLFLLSCDEVTQAKNPGATEGEAGENGAYTFYKIHDTNECRIKRPALATGETGDGYWVRSPNIQAGLGYAAYYVPYNGNIGVGTGQVLWLSASIAPAFCI